MTHPETLLNGRELQAIESHLRHLAGAIHSGIVMQRARQLADVAGDMSRSHFPDDRSAGGGTKDHDPGDRIRRFISSKSRERDARALKELEEALRHAVTGLRTALVTADRAIHGAPEYKPGANAEECAMCGTVCILETSVQCAQCAAKERRERGT